MLKIVTVSPSLGFGQLQYICHHCGLHTVFWLVAVDGRRWCKTVRKAVLRWVCQWRSRKPTISSFI